MLRKIVLFVSLLLLVGSLSLWVVSSHSVGLPCGHQGYLLSRGDIRLVVFDGSITFVRFTGFDIDQVLSHMSSPRCFCSGHGGWTASYMISDFARSPQLKDAMVSIITPLWLLPLVFSVVPGYTLSQWYRRCHRKRCGLCATCGYDLRGLVERRCPECATPFGPGDTGFSQWIMRSSVVLRKSTAITLLFGLTTSIGLWGASYFDLRYRHRPLLIRCHQGGVEWQRIDFTEEELDYLMSATPSKRLGRRVHYLGLNRDDLIRQRRTLNRPRCWAIGFDGFTTKWLPSRSSSPRPAYFVPLWIPAALLGSAGTVIRLRSSSRRGRFGRVDRSAQNTAFSASAPPRRDSHAKPAGLF